MLLWYVYDNLHDLQTSLVSATEWLFVLSMLISLVLIRTNKKLIIVFKKIQREIKGSLSFESDEEKQLYRKYNIIADKVGKFMSVFVSATVYLYYARPFIGLLIHPRTDAENNTRPFVLPLRFHMFSDYRYNVKLYTLLYMYQLPATYAPLCHAAEASLIVTSTLHVCARLSMLACRIRKSLTSSPAHFQQRIRLIVIEHLELTEMSGFLNDCFKNILLVEYLNCSFRLGVSIYVLIINKKSETMKVFIKPNMNDYWVLEIFGNPDKFENLEIFGYPSRSRKNFVFPTRPDILGSRTHLVNMFDITQTLGNDTAAFVNFCLYSVLVAAWLYLYSYIGEQLLYESLNVGDAFYDTDWTDIAARDRKSLVICMLNGQQPQYLMAGKFYKFTLFGFSEIVKSSMAFLSVLRTIIE
ncbi:uncharacterized protein LOC143210505 [Lasioglossum baleicum]|uniref:uncharacterized protein LOC143210505 n=1 Tax=Lasioglossum baleicum TaxID=434251 RepID=UPI003FCE931B